MPTPFAAPAPLPASVASVQPPSYKYVGRRGISFGYWSARDLRPTECTEES